MRLDRGPSAAVVILSSCISSISGLAVGAQLTSFSLGISYFFLRRFISKFDEFISYWLWIPLLSCFFSSRQQIVMLWLCRLFQTYFLDSSTFQLQSLSCAKMLRSMGIAWNPTLMPKLRGQGVQDIVLNQGCPLMSLNLNLFSGSVVSNPVIISRARGETNLGIEKSPAMIFLYRNVVLASSKGKYPQTIANKTTPQDQISAFRPLYRLPAIISGAAQHGDPHAVFKVYLYLQVLERPKSTILRVRLKSSSRFYGLRSRCTIPNS